MSIMSSVAGVSGVSTLTGLLNWTPETFLLSSSNFCERSCLGVFVLTLSAVTLSHGITFTTGIPIVLSLSDSTGISSLDKLLGALSSLSTLLSSKKSNMDWVDRSESTELSRLLFGRCRALLGLPYSDRLSALFRLQSFAPTDVLCTLISCFFIYLWSSFSKSVTLIWAVFNLSGWSRIGLSALSELDCNSDTLATATSESVGRFAFSLYIASNFASLAFVSANSFESLSFSIFTFL